MTDQAETPINAEMLKSSTLTLGAYLALAKRQA